MLRALAFAAKAVQQRFRPFAGSMSGSNVTRLPLASAARAVRHVFIRNLEVLAHIGVHGHEQGKMQPVRINVDLAVEDSAVLTDKLDAVVDYDAITRRIRAILAAGHINLAETLAERIAVTCFEDARVKTARIRVEKLHALPGAESGGVEIERERP
jgi:dihydroneopterin aldolase